MKEKLVIGTFLALCLYGWISIVSSLSAKPASAAEPVPVPSDDAPQEHRMIKQANQDYGSFSGWSFYRDTETGSDIACLWVRGTNTCVVLPHK